MSYEEYMESVDELLNGLQFSTAELMRKKKDELVSLCEELGLESSGKKADLAERITAHYAVNVLSAEGSIEAVREKESNDANSGNEGTTEETTESAKGRRI